MNVVRPHVEQDSKVEHAMASTTLSGGKLLASIPDVSLRQRIRQHEQAYQKRLRASKKIEKESMRAQEVAVANAIQAGKDKRQVRKLKNRLSAVRSRQRKEAEHALNAERLLSLEEQVRGLSSMIENLQSKLKKRRSRSEKHDDSRFNRNSVDSDLSRLGRGRLGLREQADTGMPVPTVRGAGTIARGQSISKLELQALMEDFDSCNETQDWLPAPNVERQHSFDQSYLSNFPPLSEETFSFDASYHNPFVSANTTDMSASSFQPSLQPCCDIFTKSNDQRKKYSAPSHLIASTAMMATTPGHALKFTGLSKLRSRRGNNERIGLASSMDHLNGGTRMLPRRRVHSFVRKAAHVKDDLPMSNVSRVKTIIVKKRKGIRPKKLCRREIVRTRSRTQLCTKKNRKSTQSRVRKPLPPRLSTGRNSCAKLKWRRALMKLSFILTPMIWQRKKHQRQLGAGKMRKKARR